MERPPGQENWWFEYRNADGKIRHVRGYADREKTERLKAKMEQDAALGKGGDPLKRGELALLRVGLLLKVIAFIGGFFVIWWPIESDTWVEEGWVISGRMVLHLFPVWGRIALCASLVACFAIGHQMGKSMERRAEERR